MDHRERPASFDIKSSFMLSGTWFILSQSAFICLIAQRELFGCVCSVSCLRASAHASFRSSSGMSLGKPSSTEPEAIR